MKFKNKEDLLTKSLEQLGIPIHEHLLDKRYWYIEKDLDLWFGTLTATFQKEEYFELLPHHLINIKNKLK